MRETNGQCAFHIETSGHQIKASLMAKYRHRTNQRRRYFRLVRFAVATLVLSINYENNSMRIAHSTKDTKERMILP